MSAVKAAKRSVTSEPNYSPVPMPATVYRPIAQQALDLTGAEITLVAVAINHDIPTSEVADLMIVETAGSAITSTPGHVIRVAGTSVGQAFVERTPRRLNNFDVAIDGVQRAGPALVLPLRTTDTVVGVLVAVRRDGARTFSDEQLDMMAAFTDQAALAWQLGATQRRARQLDILADRDRIAHDLQDHVIRGIFAVELDLQGTIPRARSTEVQQRLSGSIADLQGVIREIRTAIFGLDGAPPGTARLRHRLDEAVARFCGSELETTVQFVGPLSIVDAALADHAEAVVREAVSNAVRHAAATRLAVTVKVEDGVCIEVVDDGRGVPGDVTGSGLTNLQHRARQAGGAFTIAGAPGGGTVLRWSAPLP
ncbi:histidine kinase [Mycobacterium europaeum]|uniref:Histidine kinase n=1 Tax=Mycobacterium europaeum TaxID=761804 RepID=A0A0U1DNZ3_9MYCO|nr:histidine kinase [Mycobacterium europaeum]